MDKGRHFVCPVLSFPHLESQSGMSARLWILSDSADDRPGGSGKRPHLPAALQGPIQHSGPGFQMVSLQSVPVYPASWGLSPVGPSWALQVSVKWSRTAALS